MGGAGASVFGSGANTPQATADSSRASPQFAQAEKRIEADAKATNAQISKFGLLKSALSEGQLAAKVMSSLPSTSTADKATAALANFFNTFNASVSAANEASTATGTFSESARAKRLVQDLKSALSSDPAIADDMKKLGLTILPKGSLLQDPKKFATSLAGDPSGTLAAMNKVGSKVDSVSGGELSSSGTVGSALAALNAQNTSLSAKQSALKALDQALAATRVADPFTSTNTSEQPSSPSILSGSSIAKYRSNMTGF